MKHSDRAFFYSVKTITIIKGKFLRLFQEGNPNTETREYNSLKL